MSADPFADDVLQRLVVSNGDYQREHGHYIVPLAQRLLDSREREQRLQEERDEVREESDALRSERDVWKVRAQNAVAERQQAIDALKGIASWTNPKTDTVEELIEYCRDALVKLGEPR